MASRRGNAYFSPQLVNTIRLGISRVRGDINLPVSGDTVATTALSPWPLARRLRRKLAGLALQPRLVLGGLNRFLHRWTSGQAYDDAFLNRGTHTINWICF